MSDKVGKGKGKIYAQEIFALSRQIIDSYQQALGPLAKKYNLPPACVDILLFLDLHSGVKTAADIVKLRRYKANLVSMHVERLVRAGYLLRERDPEDRRKVTLCLSPAAAPFLREGRVIIRQFREAMMAGVTPEMLRNFAEMLKIMRSNLDQVKEDESTYD